MPDHHERADKTCLNCGTHVVGRFCHTCGQENLEPKETVWHIVRHFFEDITHFDGKVLDSLKLLLFKPGFLTEEYLKGRRARYLNPVRMYMFISAVFFLVLLYVTSHMGNSLSGDTHTQSTDSTAAQLIQAKARKGLHIDTVNIGKSQPFATQVGLPLTVHEYDSIQNALPASKRDGFIDRYMGRRTIAAAAYVNTHKDTYRHQVIEKFFHSVPQMYFISLPVFALILWLLYIRRRKEYNYVCHAIFTIHFYCLTFLVFFLMIGVLKTGSSAGDILALILLLILPVYLYVAMLRFYKQGWLKTLIKSLLLDLSIGVFVCLLVLSYIINTFLNLSS